MMQVVFTEDVMTRFVPRSSRGVTCNLSQVARDNEIFLLSPSHVSRTSILITSKQIISTKTSYIGTEVSVICRKLYRLPNNHIIWRTCHLHWKYHLAQNHATCKTYISSVEIQHLHQHISSVESLIICIYKHLITPMFFPKSNRLTLHRKN